MQRSWIGQKLSNKDLGKYIIIATIVIFYILTILIMNFCNFCNYILSTHFLLRYILAGRANNWFNDKVATKPGLQPIREVKEVLGLVAPHENKCFMQLYAFLIYLPLLSSFFALLETKQI